jgi:hypothetical protein
MKLYGKELDDELAKRKQSRQERIGNRITIHKAAKLKGIKPTELLAYEGGHDVCPHLEYEDMTAGFPFPKVIFKRCKKCGEVDENTTEKLSEDNMERAYEVYKKIYDKKDKNETL